MPDPNAVLTDVVVNVVTLDDDKDDTTELEMWINKSGEKEAAYCDVKGEHFDNGSQKIYHLVPKTNPMTRAEIAGSWLQLRINTHGTHDTWRFKVDVTLWFSDASQFPRSFGPATLDQGSTQVNFSL